MFRLKVMQSQRSWDDVVESASYDWKEAGEDRKVIDSGDCVFPAENSDVGRTIGTNSLMDSVCVLETLIRVRFLVLGSCFSLLDDIADVDHDVVSANAVSRIRTNSCVVKKLVKGLIAQGPLIVLFKKSDAMTQLESRIKDIRIPFEGWRMETQDH